MAILRRRPERRGIPKLEPRIAVLGTVMMLAFAAVGIRLYYLQVINTQQLADLADKNRIRMHRVPAPRGLIYDRKHRLLVDTRPSFDAVMVPEDVGDMSGTIENLERYLGEDHVSETLSQAEDEGRPPYDAITVKENLSWEQVVQLETHQLDLPGVNLQVTPRRRYIYGGMGAHLLGYVGEVSKDEMMKLAAYHMGDEIGKFGLERGWENFLRGTAGGQEIEVDAVGRRLRILREVQETPGQSVVLTLDLDVQQAAEKAMGARGGALIALDPNDGSIIAMISHPEFDPNIFATGIQSADWRKLTTDTNHPLENRVIQGIYPPGSTFKIVDTIAGLEERTLSPGSAYYCPGGMYFGNREYRCWRKQGHGDLSLHRAIVESCDVYFYNVGQRLGVDKISVWAHKLGLGLDSGIDLDNEKTGTIPSTAWKEKRYGERWYPAETLSVAIGQGYVAVTPMQMAQLLSQVANGGTRYKPHFVKQIEGLDGHVMKAYTPEVEAEVKISKSTLETLRDALEDVVNKPNGTGTKAALDNIIVSGKTGTAQVVKMAQGERTKTESMSEKIRDNGWFVAYAPRKHPKIAIACIVEHGGHGGSSAAPVVHDVLEKYFEMNPVPAEDQRPVEVKASKKKQQEEEDVDESN